VTERSVGQNVVWQIQRARIPAPAATARTEPAILAKAIASSRLCVLSAARNYSKIDGLTPGTTATPARTPATET
jgi:hypothetical protein